MAAVGLSSVTGYGHPFPFRKEISDGKKPNTKPVADQRVASQSNFIKIMSFF